MAQHYDFLIVGGGMVADAAAKGIREQGADGTIGILGEEPTPPFPRPALSKKLWTDPDFTQDDAALHTDDETGAELHLGVRVASVDPERHEVTTADGETFGYGRLLLATGGHPTRVDGLEPGDRVLYFRTLSDYRRLRELAADDPHVVVVGGGYIGSEIASALVQHGCTVTLVHPGEVLGDHVFPASLARSYEGLFTQAGVRLRPGLRVEGGEQTGDGVTLRLSDGSALDADAVVLGLGITPAGDVAGAAVQRSDDGGIVVDEHLATSAPDVWAAGDVAEYPDRILGRRRVEHVDNAETMGATVGRIMAGSDETYDHTPMYYSDVFDHGYEAVGTASTDLETVLDAAGDGYVVYYLDDDAVRGVLMWDVFSETGVDAARELLARGTRPDDASELVGTVR
ncbi:NAD(P)/FAD-dependent oxidoreductase [Nocardioides marinquilinus]|uniref:NAD(P)/FAD-dependent oxidoreductase n=1 Tax=Nocardioides marinquilinus TaxID=1210400 RepID=A0ABP9PK63_9ACTN